MLFGGQWQAVMLDGAVVLPDGAVVGGVRCRCVGDVGSVGVGRINVGRSWCWTVWMVGVVVGTVRYMCIGGADGG